jgi:hypothetical protein
MSEWREATAADLTKNDVFRFLDDDRDRLITARWDENGEAKFLSRIISTGRSDGLSALRPDYPVLILK